MTGKHLPVASKCLAIVLLPQKKHSKSSHASHDVNKVKDRECSAAKLGNNTTTTTKSATAALPGAFNGKEILEDFKEQNKTCYWNPALIESIRQLEYLGFVEPCTVLVSGEDIHLENLRSAWGRRVLKAPNNFTIDRIGECFDWNRVSCVLSVSGLTPPQNCTTPRTGGQEFVLFFSSHTLLFAHQNVSNDQSLILDIIGRRRPQYPSKVFIP